MMTQDTEFCEEHITTCIKKKSHHFTNRSGSNDKPELSNAFHFLHFQTLNLLQYKYGVCFALVNFGARFADGLKKTGIVSTNKSALIY